MKIFYTDQKLPNNNTYVLAHWTGKNWHDGDDPEGCNWKVVKFIRGISEQERDSMTECERKHTWKSGDVGHNNQLPYVWKEFGPGCWFGQEVDYWKPLPKL